KVASKGMGDDENVGKQDGCIKAKPADRLKRHFDSQIGRIAEVEKAPGLFPRLAIFGKIASGLAHHPDGRWEDRFTVDHSQDFALHVFSIPPCVLPQPSLV